MQTEHADQAVGHPTPWNKGKLVGPKPPFKFREIWAIRIRSQLAGRIRETLRCSTWPSTVSYAGVIS